MFRLITNNMFARLFYVELSTTPSFYSSPEICLISVKCRIPPGQALLDLLFRLRRNGATLAYQGSDSLTCAPFCTEKHLNICRAGFPFVREIKLAAHSLDTLIKAKINIGEYSLNLSGCPYKLGDLIHDQGLSCCFGGRGKPLVAMHNIRCTAVEMELGKLLDILS